MTLRALKIIGEFIEFSVYSLKIKMSSGKPTLFSKSEK